MNKIAIGSMLCAFFLWSSCGGHENHAEGDDRSEKTNVEESHAGAHETEEKDHAHSDEIVLTETRAREAGVKVAELHPSVFREVIKVSGVIEASQGDEVTVAATSDGIVSFSTLLTEGKNIGKGVTLCTVSARTLAEGDPMIKAKIAYDLAAEELKRVEGLYQQHLTTSKELLAARQAYEERQLTYRALAAQHTGAGRAISAPITGYVKNLQVREGDYVTQGQPLLTVARNRRLTLKARVPERYFGALPQIKSANFKASSENGIFRLDELHGRLLSSGKSADGDSYASIYFEFDNKGNIIPGSFVEVYLLGAEQQGVLALPQGALTEEEGLYFAYIQMDKEGYVKREVQLGASDGNLTEILSGIKAGDRVVVSGAYQLKLASATSAIPAHSHSH